jgi:hypothetical protein
VDDHDLTIGTLLHVDLHPVGPVLNGPTDRRQRVLRCLSGCTAVGGDNDVVANIDALDQPCARQAGEQGAGHKKHRSPRCRDSAEGTGRLHLLCLLHRLEARNQALGEGDDEKGKGTAVEGGG